jgi:peptide/nickel transport system ATP-binding protein
MAFPVRDVTFTVDENEILGIVGESGCGKTLTGLSILRLLPRQATIVHGCIRLDGQEVTFLRESAARQIRGRMVSMIFQSYRESLNPVFTVADQLAPVLSRRRGISMRYARRAVGPLLEEVGLFDAQRVMKSYPHELSGGMAQRVAIALAIACRPRLIIADEPGTGLDVIVREAVAETLRASVLAEAGAGIIISHDMALIGQICNRVAVMYRGEIVESGSTRQILEAPRHPYTQGLVASNTIPDRGKQFPTIPGSVPRLHEELSGCPFHPRCSQRLEICSEVKPPEVSDEVGQVRCHLYGRSDAGS